ncbi:hypothetical protein COBT_000401 [Conglomerata obtusa]
MTNKAKDFLDTATFINASSYTIFKKRSNRSTLNTQHKILEMWTVYISNSKFCIKGICDNKEIADEVYHVENFFIVHCNSGVYRLAGEMCFNGCDNLYEEFRYGIGSGWTRYEKVNHEYEVQDAANNDGLGFTNEKHINRSEKQKTKIMQPHNNIVNRLGHNTNDSKNANKTEQQKNNSKQLVDKGHDNSDENKYIKKGKELKEFLKESNESDDESLTSETNGMNYYSTKHIGKINDENKNTTNLHSIKYAENPGGNFFIDIKKSRTYSNSKNDDGLIQQDIKKLGINKIDHNKKNLIKNVMQSEINLSNNKGTYNLYTKNKTNEGFSTVTNSLCKKKLPNTIITNGKISENGQAKDYIYEKSQLTYHNILNNKNAKINVQNNNKSKILNKKHELTTNNHKSSSEHENLKNLRYKYDEKDSIKKKVSHENYNDDDNNTKDWHTDEKYELSKLINNNILNEDEEFELSKLVDNDILNEEESDALKSNNTNDSNIELKKEEDITDRKDNMNFINDQKNKHINETEVLTHKNTDDIKNKISEIPKPKLFYTKKISINSFYEKYANIVAEKEKVEKITVNDYINNKTIFSVKKSNLNHESENITKINEENLNEVEQKNQTNDFFDNENLNKEIKVNKKDKKISKNNNKNISNNNEMTFEDENDANNSIYEKDKNEKEKILLEYENNDIINELPNNNNNVRDTECYTNVSNHRSEKRKKYSIDQKELEAKKKKKVSNDACDMINNILNVKQKRSSVDQNSINNIITHTSSNEVEIYEDNYKLENHSLVNENLKNEILLYADKTGENDKDDIDLCNFTKFNRINLFDLKRIDNESLMHNQIFINKNEKNSTDDEITIVSEAINTKKLIDDTDVIRFNINEKNKSLRKDYKMNNSNHKFDKQTKNQRNNDRSSDSQNTNKEYQNTNKKMEKHVLNLSNNEIENFEALNRNKNNFLNSSISFQDTIDIKKEFEKYVQQNHIAINQQHETTSNIFCNELFENKTNVDRKNKEKIQKVSNSNKTPKKNNDKKENEKNDGINEFMGNNKNKKLSSHTPKINRSYENTIYNDADDTDHTIISNAKKSSINTKYPSDLDKNGSFKSCAKTTLTKNKFNEQIYDFYAKKVGKKNLADKKLPNSKQKKTKDKNELLTDDLLSDSLRIGNSFENSNIRSNKSTQDDIHKENHSESIFHSQNIYKDTFNNSTTNLAAENIKTYLNSANNKENEPAIIKNWKAVNDATTGSISQGEKNYDTNGSQENLKNNSRKIRSRSLDIKTENAVNVDILIQKNQSYTLPNKALDIKQSIFTNLKNNKNFKNNSHEHLINNDIQIETELFSSFSNEFDKDESSISHISPTKEDTNETTSLKISTSSNNDINESNKINQSLGTSSKNTQRNNVNTVINNIAADNDVSEQCINNINSEHTYLKNKDALFENNSNKLIDYIKTFSTSNNKKNSQEKKRRASEIIKKDPNNNFRRKKAKSVEGGILTAINIEKKSKSFSPIKENKTKTQNIILEKKYPKKNNIKKEKKITLHESFEIENTSNNLHAQKQCDIDYDMIENKKSQNLVKKSNLTKKDSIKTDNLNSEYNYYNNQQVNNVDESSTKHIVKNNSNNNFSKNNSYLINKRISIKNNSNDKKNNSSDNYKSYISEDEKNLENIENNGKEYIKNINNSKIKNREENNNTVVNNDEVSKKVFTKNKNCSMYELKFEQQHAESDDYIQEINESFDKQLINTKNNKELNDNDINNKINCNEINNRELINKPINNNNKNNNNKNSHKKNSFKSNPSQEEYNANNIIYEQISTRNNLKLNENVNHAIIDKHDLLNACLKDDKVYTSINDKGSKDNNISTPVNTKKRSTTIINNPVTQFEDNNLSTPVNTKKRSTEINNNTVTQFEDDNLGTPVNTKKRSSVNSKETTPKTNKEANSSQVNSTGSKKSSLKKKRPMFKIPKNFKIEPKNTFNSDRVSISGRKITKPE